MLARARLLLARGIEAVRRSHRPLLPKLTARSLGHSHQLKDVTVRVLEIIATAVIPIIELAVIEAPG